MVFEKGDQNTYEKNKELFFWSTKEKEDFVINLVGAKTWKLFKTIQFLEQREEGDKIGLKLTHVCSLKEKEIYLLRSFIDSPFENCMISNKR